MTDMDDRERERIARALELHADRVDGGYEPNEDEEPSYEEAYADGLRRAAHLIRTRQEGSPPEPTPSKRRG